jgi:hypothetical protein
MSSLVNNDDMEEMVAIIIRAKTLMEWKIDPDTRIVEYDEIIRKMEYFIENNCNHHYITDYIDIDHERSHTITYCEKCEKLEPIPTLPNCSFSARLLTSNSSPLLTTSNVPEIETHPTFQSP